MNTPIRRTTRHFVQLAAGLAALGFAQAQAPTAYGSFDPRSPECGAHSPGAAVALDASLAAFVQAGSLGVPAQGNVDAFSTGLELFDAERPDGRPTALRFSVDRRSQGAANAVSQQAQGNGAASDLFLLDFQTGPRQPRLDLDGSGLSPASDLDALLGALPGTARYPLFFSVDPATAQLMHCHPADVLWVPAPGAQPGPFLLFHELGLDAGDDIDALSVGPAGILFSLTTSSPTAQLFPDLGGAGLFCNGPFPWCDADLLGLRPSDELDAVQCFDPSLLPLPTLTHTPMFEGETCIVGTSGIVPGTSPWVLCSFDDPQPVSIPGLTLDILPDFVLGILPPADPLGSTSMMLPIPPDAGGIELALQAVVPPSPMTNGSWQVTNPLESDIRIAWVTTRLTQGAANNGYRLTSARGVDVVNFDNVSPAGGGPLNGPQQTMIIATVDGQRQVFTPTVRFVGGNATWQLPVPAGATVVIQSVNVYPWV